MIYESSYWKLSLLESAQRLITMKYGIDLSEDTLAQIERDIFIGFYSIRKLFDTIKVTDALKSNKYPVTWFPHQGREVTWLNNYRVDEHYNLNSKNIETRDLWFIASRLIHSFVFQISLTEQGGLEGIFFASDSGRYPRAYTGYLLLQLHAELTRILFALVSNVIRYNLFIHAYATDKVTWRPNNVLFPVNLT